MVPEVSRLILTTLGVSRMVSEGSKMVPDGSRMSGNGSGSFRKVPEAPETLMNSAVDSACEQYT